MRTAHEAAILLAVILNRAGKTRARVSATTIKRVAGRQHLKSAFVLELVREIQEFGWVLCELATGGFGAIRATALEAARAVTAKRGLNERDEKMIRRGDWSALEKEATPDQDENPGDEEQP
jgi:hypothetical protein